MITGVYRCFAADNTLLYVGATKNLGNRMMDHKHGSRWFAQVHRLTFEVCDNMATALSKEREAIRTEGPAFNKMENPAWLQQPHPTVPPNGRAIRITLSMHPRVVAMARRMANQMAEVAGSKPNVSGLIARLLAEKRNEREGVSA